MKLSTSTQYNHSLIAGKGRIFDETRLDELAEAIGVNVEDLSLGLNGHVVKFTQLHVNTFSSFDEDIVNEILTPFTIPAPESNKVTA